MINCTCNLTFLTCIVSNMTANKLKMFSVLTLVQFKMSAAPSSYKGFPYLSWLYKYTCFISFIINCVFLSTDYFNYPVAIKMAPYFPVEQRVAKFSVCMPYPSFIKKSDKSFFSANEEFFLDQNVSHLYETTPDPDKVLTKCSFRNWKLDFVIDVNNVSECVRFFRVEKYRMGGYMCYKFNPPEYQYILNSIVYTFNDPRTLYELTLNAPFNSGYKLNPMVHFENYPFDDLVYDQELLPSVGKNEYYTISHRLFELHRLPAPYESNCKNESNYACFQRCLTKAFKPYGLTSVNNFPELDESNLTIPYLKKSYQGKPFLEIVMEHKSKCVTTCAKYKKCHQNLTTTIISAPGPSADKLVFGVEMVAEPVTLTKGKAKFPFIDFSTQIASLAGIWLGFSVLNIFSFTEKPISSESYLKRLVRLNAKCKLALMIKKEIESAMGVLLNSNSWSSHVDKPMDQPVPGSNVDSQPNVQRKERRNSKFILKYSSVFVKLTVLVAFTVQIFTVCQSYFEFDTRTFLKFEMNPTIEAPVVVICIPFEEMFETKTVIGTINRTNYNDIFRTVDNYFNYTLNDIFENTWPIVKIIKECRFRRREANSSWIHVIHPKDECITKFEISRFFYDRQICFKLQFKENTTDTQAAHKYIASDPGIFFSFILEPHVAWVSRFMVILYESSYLPLESKDFAVGVQRSRSNRLFLLSMHVHRKTSLPFPYKTGCSKKFGRSGCIRECMIDRTVRQLDRLPYSEIFSYKEVVNSSLGNKKLLSYSDLNNSRSIEIWNKIETYCEDQCDYTFCDDSVTNTLISNSYRSKYRLELAIDARATPDLFTQELARFPLYEFYYQSFCTCSFWLAMTFLALNPFEIFLKQHINQQVCKSRRRFVKIKKTLNRLKQLIASINISFGLHILEPLVMPGQKFLWTKKVLSSLKRWSGFRCLLQIICTIGCSVHLFITICNYTQYPTNMNTHSTNEVNSLTHDMSICITMNQALLGSNNTSIRNKCKKTGQRDVTPPLNIREILENTPSTSDLVRACGYRGIKEVQREENIKLKGLTDRIFFYELFNKSFCQSLFQVEKFLLQGYVCYKFHQINVVSMSALQERHPINHPDVIFSLIVNTNVLTDRFTVSVTANGLIPLYSNLWSPNIYKKNESTVYTVTYIRYERKIKPPPYSNDGFSDISFLGCFNVCFRKKLLPFGITNADLIRSPQSNLRFVTQSDRVRPLINTIINNFEDTCKQSCLLKNEYSRMRYPNQSNFVTIVDEGREYSDPNSTEFVLSNTEYPVIVVVFREAIDLIQLVINLGSIMGIWFGFSAIQLDPIQYARASTSSIDANDISLCEFELDLLSKTIFRLNFFFFQRKK